MRGRGRDLILLKPSTYSRIASTIYDLQTLNGDKIGIVDISWVLLCIKSGIRFTELDVPLSRYYLTTYLNAAVELLNLDTGDKKITLNTIFTNGRMIEIARLYGFNLEYECIYYGIPII